MDYKILIVDDEKTVREGLKAMIGTMERWKCVGEATNGAKALEQIKQHKPDLVLSDIRMPEMDGLQLLEKIGAMHSDAMVVFLTGYPDFEYAQTAIRYGAFDYLLKPMRAQDIAEAVRNAERKIDQTRSAKQQHIQLGQVATDYEKSMSERIVREVIYGGNLERFDLAQWPFFRACERVSVLSVIVEQTAALNQGAAGSNIEELLSELMPSSMVLKGGRDEWAILMGWKRNEDALHEIRKVQELVNSLRRMTAFPWKVGIGGMVPVGQAVVSYDQSKFAAYLASPEKQVVFYHEISGSDESLMLVPIEQEFAMMKSVRKGDTDEALTVLAQLESYYRRMTLGELGKHALQLHVHLQNCIASLDDEAGEGWILPDAAPTNHHDVLRNLSEGIAYCAKRIQKHRTRQMNHVVQRVMGIVREHYFTDIKLGDIALRLAINPSYLSTLFKHETGASFSDYLSRYRIEKSLPLLKKPQMKIYEVAQQVGYTDGRHFSQLFRKTIGMTPFEYRNKNGMLSDYGELELI